MTQVAPTAGNPYVFIVGTPRSGTTLLKRLVDAHPSIAITRETHWIPRYYRRRIAVTDTGMVKPGIIEELFAEKRFAHLRMRREKIEALLSDGREMSYADFVSRIFDLYAQREQKTFVGDKTPPYVRHISLLHELWPSARFVHLIRDGRDVCLSMLTWRMADRAAGRRAGWQEDPVTTTALWWEWLVRLGREAGRKLGAELYREVSYEKLVADPGGQCEELCDFLDLPFDSSMLRFHEGRSQAEPGLSANRAWLPPTQGLRNWRTQMPVEDIERFEAAAGDLLDELAYPKTTSTFSQSTHDHAARMRDLFDGRPLPGSW